MVISYNVFRACRTELHPFNKSPIKSDAFPGFLALINFREHDQLIFQEWSENWPIFEEFAHHAARTHFNLLSDWWTEHPYSNEIMSFSYDSLPNRIYGHSEIYTPRGKLSPKEQLAFERNLQSSLIVYRTGVQRPARKSVS